MDRLTQARGTYARATPLPRRSERQPSLLLAVLAGLIVGVAAGLAGTWKHACTATFRVDGSTHALPLAKVRDELTVYAAGRLGPLSTNSRFASWFVDSPGQRLLRLGTVVTDRKSGSDALASLARGFVAHWQTVGERARQTPSKSEAVVVRLAEGIHQRIVDADEAAARAEAAIPADDPDQIRESLLARWTHLRDQFTRKRQEAASALEHLRRLEAQPAPSVAIVSDAERHKAIHDDPALRNDLAELELSLSELKLQALNVWQTSSGPLERLAAAVDVLVRAAEDERDRPLDDAVRGKLIAVADGARELQHLVATFAREWTAEFKRLQQLPVDPLSATALTLYQRLRRRLGEFRHVGGKQVADVEQAVHTVGASQTDAARYHVLASSLLRAFHDVNAGFRRFEFAASRLEPVNNFRLDAALIAARGLNKRAKAQIAVIDERLQKAAVQRARRQRDEELAHAEESVEQLRHAADEVVVELIDLQGALNAGTDRTTAYAVATDRVEQSRERVEHLRGDLRVVEAELEQLAAQRSAAAYPSVEFVSCEVSPRAINVEQRVRAGALGAALTLLLVFLAQCWVARQR